MTAHLSHTRRRWTPAATLLAAIAAGTLLVGGLAPVSAQDEMASHPAHIHEGTCDDLNPKPAFPLTNVSEMGMMEGMMEGTPEADDAAMEMSEPMGAETAFGVETSFTMVDVSLEEIVEGGHAINIHQSEENIEEYIACGDIGGRIQTGPEMDEGGTLVVGLGQLNDSGYTGIAVLEGKGDQTEVVIYLAEGLSGGDDEATPAAGSSKTTVTVETVDFAFEPAELEVAVGTTVTWTNVGGQPHTATAEDGSFDTGVLSTGKSASHTFTEPGTYPYVCTLHENTMQAVLVVT